MRNLWKHAEPHPILAIEQPPPLGAAVEMRQSLQLVSTVVRRPQTRRCGRGFRSSLGRQRQIRGSLPSHGARVLEVRVHLPPAERQDSNPRSPQNGPEMLRCGSSYFIIAASVKLQFDPIFFLWSRAA